MNNIDKYIQLLIDRCLNIKESLFISYESCVNTDFVSKIVKYAKSKGITDIYLCDANSYKKHEILKNETLEEIKQEEIFNCSVWDEYAKKNAAFLMIESELPGLMDDVDAKKLALARKIQITSKPIYRKKQSINEISWCICAYPNEIWAKTIFPNDDNSYKKMLDVVLSMCMCDHDDPIKAWDNYLTKTSERIVKLNDLKIQKLHYTNSLGTDLWLELPDKAIWCGACNEKNMLVNMPSYEVFTSPYNTKTNGIVYASKPLIYNNMEITDFWLKFKDGKVIDYGAKTGKDLLESIINSDETSSMLGECALVEYHSPISNTGLVFKTTLFDENASCHLALGAGFPECYDADLSEEELHNKGVNKSSNHVDFMIGTNDLMIEAFNHQGSIMIMENGDFVF